MKHSEKIKMAKKMPMTEKERESKEGIFTTDAWDARKKSKIQKQLNQGKKIK